ncbi:MAG: translation initiation factor IF-3 [Bacillota bacterium]
MNDQIRGREVRVVSETGEQLGIMMLRDALRVAAERNLDLVEVAPTARPPVCRIMDYGRFKYEQAKRDRESRKKQHSVRIKEVQMRPTIEDHDFDVWVKRGERFLREGDKVKVVIKFRGREIHHPELGKQVCERFVQELSKFCTIERPPRVEGRNMILILAPTGEKEGGRHSGQDQAKDAPQSV